MADLAAFAAQLSLTDEGEGRFRWGGEGRGFAFAGLLTSLMLQASVKAIPGKELRSIDAVFVRAVRNGELDVEIAVRPLHVGGQLTAVVVTVEQANRVCTHGQVLLGPRTEDLIRHHTEPPEVPELEEAVVAYEHHPGESRVVGGVDLTRDDQTLPPVISIWRRASGLVDLGVLPEALLAFDASAYLTGAALLPHAGLGLSGAHGTFTAAITASHMVFHEPIDLDDWVLVHNRSTYGGGGWAHGRGEVYGDSGDLLVSFALEGMVRPMSGEHTRAL